jgi:hypothetical protein
MLAVLLSALSELALLSLAAQVVLLLMLLFEIQSGLADGGPGGSARDGQDGPSRRRAIPA